MRAAIILVVAIIVSMSIQAGYSQLQAGIDAASVNMAKLEIIK